MSESNLSTLVFLCRKITRSFKQFCIVGFTPDCILAPNEPFRRSPVASPVPPQSAAEISRPKVYRRVLVVFLSSLTIVVALTLNLPNTAKAAEPSKTKATMEGRVQELIPEIEAYITSGMKGFDIPGLAIGIVANNRLIYAKGFGVRSKSNGLPVDTRTVFQIGSTTKAFLTATMAIMVDRGKLRWDDRVVDLYPEFRLKDPWVTREFRVFDLPAQRSGLPPLVNDILVMLDFKEAALIRSLRYVEPVSSFRTTFAYTNITHLLASRIVATAAGASDWNVVLQKELLDPLGMKDSTYTAEAIEGAANHANGHRWTPEGTVEVPFTRFSLTTWPGPATSTPTLRTWRAGSACSLGMAPSMDAASSRPRISPIRACQRWHSTTRYSMTLAGITI